MKEMDIFDLLAHGHLLGVKIGSREEDVINAIGTSCLQRISARPGSDDLAMLLSGGLEFHLFLGNVINMIVKMRHYSGSHFLTIGSDKYKMNARTSIGGAIRLLDEVGIAWEFYQKHSAGKRVEIITEGSATLEFLAKRGNVRINRIHLSEEDRFADRSG